MFRRLPASLPRDSQIPNTLGGLGCFINDDNQVRSKSNPEEPWAYKVSKSSRYNEMRRTVVHHIIREEVAKCMTSLNMQLLYMPHMALEQPVGQPYMPIYTTPLKELSKKTRLVVVVPCQNVELGLWSVHDIFGDLGIESGSAISLVRMLNECERDSPGLIILNPNETYFSHEFNRPLTLQGWQDRPRISALHPMPVVDSKWNRIPGHESVENHIQSVLENLIDNEKYVQPNCKIDVVGLMEGGNKAMEYLDHNCSYTRTTLQLVVLTNSRGSLGKQDIHYISRLSVAKLQLYYMQRICTVPERKGSRMGYISGSTKYTHCMPIAGRVTGRLGATHYLSNLFWRRARLFPTDLSSNAENHLSLDGRGSKR
jgi:hypothetical protein